MTQKKILFVEDDRECFERITAGLERCLEFEAIFGHAANTIEAKKLVDKSPWDLVIIDGMLKTATDGFMLALLLDQRGYKVITYSISDATAEIRERKIPFIFLRWESPHHIMANKIREVLF